MSTLRVLLSCFTVASTSIVHWSNAVACFELELDVSAAACRVLRREAASGEGAGDCPLAVACSDCPLSQVERGPVPCPWSSRRHLQAASARGWPQKAACSLQPHLPSKHTARLVALRNVKHGVEVHWSSRSGQRRRSYAARDCGLSFDAVPDGGGRLHGTSMDTAANR